MADCKVPTRHAIYALFLAWCLGNSAFEALAFGPSHRNHVPARHPPRHRWNPCEQRTNVGARFMMPLDANPPLDASDQALSLWVLAFASSHIGMSAVRTGIISSLGDMLDGMKLVGNEWRLPDWWPGDNTGGNNIFPDDLTAGRQAYRALYTAVSFLTLGSAFGAYLHSSSLTLEEGAQSFGGLHDACLAAAALSFGAAIASLFNASPLGLMPSFEGTSGEDGDVAGGAIAGLRRDDALKFTTRGLTRITRHPLILPVVPWGFATACLAGGRPCDYILFGGLSIYAIAGCLAQDLRVIREEGSVGTVSEPKQIEERRAEEVKKQSSCDFSSTKRHSSLSKQ